MSIKIMIVDDAPFIREVLRHIVENAGYLVVAEAEDGQEAEALALKIKPDVIIMDIVLPKKNGLDVVKSILEQNPDTQVIACSTLDQEMMLVRALDVGCVDYLTKPFRAADVIKSIKGTQKSVKQGVEA